MCVCACACACACAVVVENISREWLVRHPKVCELLLKSVSFPSKFSDILPKENFQNLLCGEIDASGIHRTPDKFC